MSAAPSPTPQRTALRQWRGCLPVALVVLVLVGGLGTGVVWSARNADAAARSRDAFFAALRAGDAEAAYAELSARRRAQVSREAFAAVAAHPALRASTGGTFRPPKQRSPGQCTYGKLRTSEGEWAAQVFLIGEDDGAWRVDAVAVQRPADVQLGILLEECGYWTGTRMGYQGPEVERLTPGP